MRVVKRRLTASWPLLTTTIRTSDSFFAAVAFKRGNNVNVKTKGPIWLRQNVEFSRMQVIRAVAVVLGSNKLADTVFVQLKWYCWKTMMV